VDIGDRVRAGQTLLVIESPELDQELASVRADAEAARSAWKQAQANTARARETVLEADARLQQSNASETLAGKTAERWATLVQKGVLPRQEGDEREYAYRMRKSEVVANEAGLRTAESTVAAAESGVAAAEARVQAALANVARIERLASFERVIAPFDGVITERMVEQGDLISAAQPHKLFAIAQPKTIRVKIEVPQTFASELHEGQEAKIAVRELAGKQFAGKVVRTASSLNAASRTLLVEVQIDNRDGALLPGMYGEVSFAVHRTAPLTVIPADALVVNAEGTRVAVVTPDGKLRFAKVEIARDLGQTLELASGLAPGAQVVLNAGELLSEGQAVAVAPTKGN
jgi:multidrug efflux pump subunit AcrA (membrane-fusion protein)